MAVKPPASSRARCHRKRKLQIDVGRHAIRRVAGDEVFVTAATDAGGKDELATGLLPPSSSDI
jgi:hypothetical protein